jgi:hypothetical protein
MAAPRKTPLASYRNRMKRQGFVPVDVQVREEDAALVRTIAGALTDPARAAEARAFLRKRFAEPPRGLKALLVAAPLERIDIECARRSSSGRSMTFLIDTNIIFEIRKRPNCNPNVAVSAPLKARAVLARILACIAVKQSDEIRS